MRSPLQAVNGPSRNEPGVLGNTPYSGHALDQMQIRGIPPSVTQQAIQDGDPSLGNATGTTKYYDSSNNMSVIQDDATETVITVRPGK